MELSKLPFPLTPKNSGFLFVGIVLIFLFGACDRKQDGPGAYTPAFKKLNDSVSSLAVKNPYSALKTLDSGFAKLKNPSVNDRFRLMANHFSMKVKTLRDFKGALATADSMLELIAVNGGQKMYPANFAEACFAKGDAFFELHNYNDAYRYNFNGYATGKSYLDNYVISGYSYRMGMIAYQQSNYKVSATYFKDSFDQAHPYTQDFAMFFRNQEVLDNIAIVYRDMENTDSALVYFDKTVKYLDDNAPRFPKQAISINVARAVVNGNQADIYVKRGDYNTAEQLLKKSIEVNLMPTGDNSDGMLSEIKLARIYRDQHKYDLFSTILNSLQTQLDAIPYAKKTPDNKRVEADWFLLKSNLFEQNKQLDLALRYNQRYSLLKDSVAEATRKLKEMSISDKFDNYDKENQIETLTRYTRLQKIYLWVLLLAGLLAIVIIFMIYRNWRGSKKEISTISKLNEEVNKQKGDLEQTLARLNESSNEKDRILHTVAHDLRNPLGGIASLSNIMAEDDLDEEHLEYINLIKDTADNSLQLINEIFEATDAGIGEIKLQPVDVNMVLHNVVELLKFKASEKNQQIVVKLLGKPVMVMASREKLWRVLSNLIVNSIKFSPAKTKITVEAQDNGSEVIICVADHGIGIPENMKPKIFNMFTEAKRMGTMGEKSFGLGLSICRQIIEKHGGKLWHEDNPGGGSIFCISLNKAV